jgi:hypothetical protein
VGSDRRSQAHRLASGGPSVLTERSKVAVNPRDSVSDTDLCSVAPALRLRFTSYCSPTGLFWVHNSDLCSGVYRCTQDRSTLMKRSSHWTSLARSTGVSEAALPKGW